jgi:hypothetical protein
MLTNGAPLHHVWWFTRGEYYVTKLSLTESGWSIHAHNTRGSFICVKRKKEKTPEADFLQMLKCLEKLSNWMLRSPAPAVTGGVPCILFFCLWSKMLLCVPKKKEKKRKKKVEQLRSSTFNNTSFWTAALRYSSPGSQSNQIGDGQHKCYQDRWLVI